MKKKSTAKRGRPSKFTPEIAVKICDRISRGEPLASICRDKGMPCREVVYDWMDKDNAFSQRIARARARGYDAIAEECLDIADDSCHDTIFGDNGDRPDAEWIARSRLRVETRLKLLAKWCPKKYGEKIEVEQTGEQTVRICIGGAAATDG